MRGFYDILGLMLSIWGSTDSLARDIKIHLKREKYFQFFSNEFNLISEIELRKSFIKMSFKKKQYSVVFSPLFKNFKAIIQIKNIPRIPELEINR